VAWKIRLYDKHHWHWKIYTAQMQSRVAQFVHLNWTGLGHCLLKLPL
jgi:hypothetical protein